MPADALWRAQTQRAVENFPISGRGLEPAQIRALAQIKGAAAEVNGELGVLDADMADGDRRGRRARGRRRLRRPVPGRRVPDRVGHSSNMNANEVIATLATPSARAGTCTPTTTSTPPSPATTCSRPPSTSPRPRHGATTCSRRWPTWRRRWRPSRAEFADGGQGRPHPPDGRHPGHPGPGVRRVRRPGPLRRRTGWSGRCPGWPSCHWAAPPWAPGSTRRPASPPR